MIRMGMTPEDRAEKKKRDKQRQKANKGKATTLRASGVVGSPISGSGSAKVRAHKDVLPPMKKVDRTTSTMSAYDAPAPRSALFQEGAEDHDAK